MTFRICRGFVEAQTFADTLILKDLAQGIAK